MTRSTCVFVLVTALASCVLAAPAPRVVENSDQPADGRQRLVLEPVWRHGGIDDEAFFGVIGGVAAARDGAVYLADAQLMTVHVVAPDGELLPSLGRRGEGPGEVTRLGGVVPMLDGTVGLVQLMPGQVVMVDAGGRPAGALVPRWPEEGGRLMLQDLQRAGEHLVAAGRRMRPGEAGPVVDQWIARLDADGTLSHFYHRERIARSFADGAMSEADFDWVGAGRWTTMPDGRVILAPERNAYRLEMVGADGPELAFGRPYRSRPRTDAELAAVRARFQRARGPGRGGRRPAALDVEVLPDAPDIVAIHARPDGEIWVQTSRSHVARPAGVMLTYDVFDAAGNFTRQVAVECEGVAPRDLLHPLPDGRFVLVIGHAAAMSAMRGIASDAADAEDVVLEVVGLRPAAQPEENRP